MEIRFQPGPFATATPTLGLGASQVAGTREPTPAHVEPEPVYVPPEVTTIIHAVFGPQGEKAVRVAFCESNLNPGAVGYGGSYLGLFQIWVGHGYDYWSLFDPTYNAWAAWDLSRGGADWTPWPTCGSR